MNEQLKLDRVENTREHAIVHCLLLEPGLRGYGREEFAEWRIRNAQDRFRPVVNETLDMK